MKIGLILKKNKLLFLVALAYIAVFVISSENCMKSVGNSVYYLVEMFEVLPVIFLLTVVIEALVPKEMIMNGLGEKSGFKGNMLALLLGSISAGPIYAAFPISKTLFKKGSSVSNIVIILSTWAVIKVPMLANEAKFLGINFMIVRWVLTVIAIFVMAYIIGMLVNKKDLQVENDNSALLKINEEYCIGCGLCLKLLPEYYEMNHNKAVVIKEPEGEESLRAIHESIEKCPSKAITFREENAS